MDDFTQEHLTRIFTQCLTAPDRAIGNWGATPGDNVDALWRIEPPTHWERPVPAGQWQMVHA
jgi:hypothetical protein